MSTLSLWVDESEKDSLLAVGGILVPWNQVPRLVRGWQDLKTNEGLDPCAELKWNLPKSHPTRRALESQCRSSKDVLARAVNYLGSGDVSLVVAVMCEQRPMDRWKTLWPKASVRDFYCEGLRYLLQRAAEEVREADFDGAIVVCDTPELGKQRFVRSSIRRGARAVKDAYADWYMNGVGVGPGKVYHNGPLKDAGFHPSVLYGDATYHDMLQMADVVVGATRGWIDSVKRATPDRWVAQQVRTLSLKFRKRHGNPSFWGDGLVLWPWNNVLWDALKKSI